MRLFLFAFILMAALACGPSTEGDTSDKATSEAAKNEAHAEGAGAAHGDLPPPAAATLTEAQVNTFLTDLGEFAGHGGWKESDIKDMTDEIKKIEVGKSQMGNLHLDYKGGHSDVIMKVERTEEGFLMTINAQDQELMKAVKEKLEAASKS